MSSAKITLLGLEKYMQLNNDSLFTNLSVPANTLDKSVLVDTILLRGGEFEVLYSEPLFMKDMVKIWSDKMQQTMAKWYAALNQTYSPIENYDRTEDWQETSNGSSSDTSSGTGSATSENKRSAYDSSVYEPESKNESSTTNSTTGSTTLTNTNIHAGRIHGNIGVTTNQQMIEAEISLYYKNVYELLTDVFLAEFILPVY